MKKTVRQLQQHLRNELADLYPKGEIESLCFLIFEYSCHFSRTDVMLKQDVVLSENKIKQINTIIDDLKTGKPIQYILGETEFYGLKLKVNPLVLIPRPETEELVDWILKDNTLTNSLLLDIGTGSACIISALSANLPDSMCFSVDIDKNALEIAKQNAKNLGLDIKFAQFDVLNEKILFDDNYKFDIIVSNPPYVRELEKHQMANNVLDFEPHKALFVPDNDPLIFYQKICDLSKRYLKPGGKLFFEINEYLYQQIKDLFENYGFENIELKKDIHGKYRMAKAKK